MFFSMNLYTLFDKIVLFGKIHCCCSLVGIRYNVAQPVFIYVEDLHQRQVLRRIMVLFRNIFISFCYHSSRRYCLLITTCSMFTSNILFIFSCLINNFLEKLALKRNGNLHDEHLTYVNDG
jgi:hypothetical protein